MSTVYLAGGINGLSDEDANDWRDKAKRLLPREIGVLDPMSRDYRGVEDANVEAIVSGDLADIAKCDAVIAYCPRPSWGTAMEIHHVATEAKWGRDSNNYVKPRRTVAIVPAGQSVSPWLRFHAEAVVETLEAAVELVTDWLGVR